MKLRLRHMPVRTFPLLAVMVLCAVPAASAHGQTLNLRQSLSAGTARQQPGLRSPAPSAQALDGAVQQLAGVARSQVTAQNVCAAPQPGHAACAAQALVRRSDHRLLHPHVTPQRTFTQVFPRRRSPAAAAQLAAQGTMSSTPASAPAAGTPGFLQQAYDLTYLSQTAGGGDTVAIVDAGDDPNAQSDLATYRSNYGLPACTTGNGCFAKVNQSGTGTPLPASAGSDWATEESLDLDAVSALCPNCHILLVEANSSSLTDLDAGISAAQGLGANQISNSWAGASSSPFGISSFPGVAVIAATGDHGYLGAGVDAYPAAFPGVTAAGGTTLTGASASANTRGYSESAWSLNSSGQTWGGGSGCDTHVAKPSYQADTGCVGRSYSDLSADANPDTGLRIYDSGDGGWFIVGGTSLATPLIAAYEAVTGVNGTTAQWAYTNSALLNDPTTGSSGTCASGITYICNAGTGYDGPTGVGSISGDIVPGAPGIGGPAIGDGTTNTYAQTVGTTTATVTGGVYPNGLDTTYDWQYGTTTAYGRQTTPVDVGSGHAPAVAPATLTGLTPGVTYHFRLVAQNSAGTDYGYDYTLATTQVSNVAPINTVRPAISGNPLQGQTLITSTGTWAPTPNAYAYQWQRSTDGGATWASISGATGSSYTVATGDLGDEIAVVVTASDSYGSTTATSTPSGPVGSGQPIATSGPTVLGHADQGQILNATSTWNPSGASYAYQWQSSSDGGSTWSNISGAAGTTYTLSASDLGHLVRVSVTAVNTYGSVTSNSAGIGPILANAPINSAVPALSGSPQRSATLTATPGAWTGLGDQISYQWQRSVDGTTWNTINGATSSTYILALADEGDQVRALVTATNPYGTTSTPSAATQPIAPYPPAVTSRPVITGVAERGVTLNASQGVWTGPDNIYSYQWQRDAGEGYVDIFAATAASYTLGLDDEGSTVRVVVTAADPDATITEASLATATVTDAVPVNTSAPTITGTVQRAAILTANVGAWAGIDNLYSYQWQSSTDGTTWTNIAGATAATDTVATTDEHAHLRVMVTATNPDGTASVPSAATVAVPASPPHNTTAPALAGVPQRGMTLVGTQGAWDGVGNAYAYQWQRSPDGTTWTNISGATGLTYALAVADETDFVRLSVTATNPDGTSTATGQPTSVILVTAPVNTAVPALTGTAIRSSSLAADNGTWSGIGNAYTCQWQRSTNSGTTWTNISGATGFNYTVTVPDEGSMLRAVITAVNPDGTVAVPSAATTTVSSAPPASTSAPTISGAPTRGDTLTSTPGGWSGVGNAYSEQWQRSADGTTWTNIPGATASIYLLTVADEGDAVRLLVTAVNADATVSVPSAATTPIASAAPANTAPPALSGAAQRGLTLNSAQGTWNGIGDTYAYQWQRSADGSTWTDIAGATGASYQLVKADEGDVVRVAVTGSNPDGTATADSAPSATVVGTPPVNTILPVLSGTVQRGQTLQSSAGTWLGIGTAYAYQWQQSGDGGTTWTDIGGATTTTYAVGPIDEGHELRMKMTATNIDGVASVNTAATVAVPVAAPVNTVAPTVSGTARRGSLLTATPGTWSGIGNTLAYQWQRSTDSGSTWTSLAGAISNTYTLGVGDEGAQLRILVTAANPDATVTAPSAATAVVGASAPVNTGAPTTRGVAQRGNTVSSTAGVWSGTGNTFTLQWQRSSDATHWINIDGATSAVYTLRVADEGDTVRLLVTAANPDGTASAASPASATVTGTPPVNTAPPLLVGAAQRTSTLTATSGTWSGVGDVLAYQWERSADGGATWTNIADATTTAYTLAAADEDDVVRLLVTAVNPDGTVAAGSAPTSVVQAALPVNTQTPLILGAPSVGGTLSTDNGTWSPVADSYSYAWQRGDATDGYQNIAGATGATYTPAAADVGENIRVVVTAIDVDGSTAATSAPTPPAQQPPVNLTAPAAPSGTLQNGFLLTPDSGSWDNPATYTYTWQRCPAGATGVTSACSSVGAGTTYALGVGDIGSKMAVTVTATSLGGSTTANSALTAVITGQPLTQLAPPSISGNPQVPNTLFANPGTWSIPPTDVTYEWNRCDADGISNCTLIAADVAHYTLGATDDGHTIVLEAEVSSPGRVTTAQSAPLTVQDQPLPQPNIPPTVSGTATRTFLLGSTPGNWSNSPTSLSYQWERCNVAGHSCQAIPGATQAIYQLAAADEGGTVTIAVTARNSSGATTAMAAPSGVVIGLLPVATHRPGLSTLGVQQSAPITVGGAAWQTTSGTTYATQWERCNAGGTACAAITGATASGYMPVAADVGHTLVAQITATNVDGSVASSSPPSDVVLPAAPRWRDLPVLNATNGYVGGVLTVTPGVWTGPVVTTDTTAVMRCTNTCVSITSTHSYTIVTADIGSVLRVRETAGNAGGTTVVWSSQYVGPVASSASASAVLAGGPTVLRNKDGDPLATAQISTSAQVSADAVFAGVARHGAGPVRSVTVRRAGKVKGTLRAWVCSVRAAKGTSVPPPCTKQITLRGTARLKLPATITGKVRVVVVRRGR
jgi:hypothetical protein